MSDPLITKEEFEGWLALPVTRTVLRAVLPAKKRRIEEDWSAGTFSYPTIEASALKSAEKIGECTILSYLIDMDYQTILTEIGDDTDGDRQHSEASAGGRGL